jgi:tetratricopeptide (TPR) repeat protein
LLVHGLVDDPLYGSRAVLLWWIPVGLLAAQAQVVTGEARHALTRLEFGLAVGVGGMLLLLLVGLFIVPPWRAQAMANLGAVYQTQIELGNYQPDLWDTKTIDQVRRQVDLSLATKAFDQALAIDPHQRTALQRLAEIDLSRQAYDQALVKLQKIPASRASDAVSRLLLGDALVAAGDPKGAAVIVEGLPFSQGRLLEQSWYRYYKDGDTKRENWASQAASLLK